MKFRCIDMAREYIPDVNLRNNGMLFRILNPAWVPMSVICANGEEIWSCNREDEARMIRDWNDRYAN